MATAQRSLQRGELRVLAILGVPTFALALAITTVSTYLPVLAEGFSDSSIVVGLLIGGEGLMALWLPLVVGAWSDRLRTPLGSRLPFIIAATPALILALALLGFVTSIAAAAVVLALFFAAYFVAYEPYRALYPDLVDDEIVGRAQSSQAIFRGLGTFLALVGGGLLISISDPLPFLAAAVVVGRQHGRVLRRGRPPPPPRAATRRGRGRRGLSTDVRPRPRPAPAAGLPRCQHALGARAVGAQDLRGALRDQDARPLAGRLVAGHRRRGRVVLGGALVSGNRRPRRARARDARRPRPLRLGLIVPFVTTKPWIVAIAAPLVAFGGGVTMSLPYALLIPMMPRGAHGAVTGLYSVSRGLGTALGPLLGGVAIQAAGGDYRWVWAVCAAAVLVSIPTMAPLGDD